MRTSCIFKAVISGLTAVLIFQGCATKADREKLQEAQAEGVGAPAVAADPATSENKKLEGNLVSSIKFKTGRTELSPAVKKKIDAAIAEAKSKGAIEEIHLAVWSDKNYPTDEKKLSQSDVNLAEDRAETVKDYVKERESGAKVSVHNMAKQPGFLAELLGTDDVELKRDLEQAGFTSSKANNSSKALLVFDLD